MKEKGLLIGMLCTVVIVMAVAFASFNTTLKINGTASITSTWSVAFIEDGSSCSDGSKITISGTTATFAVNLESPGDSVTCNLTVQNSGTLDAKLSSIIATPDGNAPITFTVTPTTADLATRPVLAANNDTEVITVVTTYDADTEGQPKDIQNTILVKANYVQNLNTTN